MSECEPQTHGCPQLVACMSDIISVFLLEGKNTLLKMYNVLQKLWCNTVRILLSRVHGLLCRFFLTVVVAITARKVLVIAINLQFDPITMLGHPVAQFFYGTALQVGRSRVRFPMMSLEFFIDIILATALWPWG